MTLPNFTWFPLCAALIWTPLGVLAADLSPDYLKGLWSLEGKDKCGADVEYILFADDGTFKTGRLNRIETVGFYRIEDDLIDLHMVGSLALFSDKLSPFDGQFQYFHMRTLPTSVSDNEFQGVASFGGDLERFAAARCP